MSSDCVFENLRMSSSGAKLLEDDTSLIRGVGLLGAALCARGVRRNVGCVSQATRSGLVLKLAEYRQPVARPPK